MTRPRVLLADDNPDLLAALRDLVGGLGEVVGTVRDRQSLVQAAQRLKPDIIFTDISMPKMNGLDATRALQVHVPQSRIIILSSYHEPAYVTLAFNAGARGYIGTAAPASASWEGANQAVYFPISVPTTCIVRRLWWVNGSTVSASYNLDCGVYLDAGYKPGAKLVSTGSTAQGTASQVQFVDVTDTTVTAGLLWIALAIDTASATVYHEDLMLLAVVVGAISVLSSLQGIWKALRVDPNEALSG